MTALKFSRTYPLVLVVNYSGGSEESQARGSGLFEHAAGEKWNLVFGGPHYDDILAKT
jgi:hypothetical protein